MQLDDILRALFLGLSGIALFSLDPLLWVAWPIALAGVMYGKRIDDSAVIVFCLGVPLAVAVGYTSLFLSVVSVLLLLVSSLGSDRLLRTTNRVSLVVLIAGSAAILLFIPGFDPFIAALLVILAASISAVVLYLSGHLVRMSARGGPV